jgi:hypothetical protein
MSLTYSAISSPLQYTQGDLLPSTLTATLTPADSGLTFSVTPAFPKGITIGSTTGKIEGRVTAAAIQAAYTVKASTKEGYGASFIIILTVKECVPPEIIYPSVANSCVSASGTIVGIPCMPVSPLSALPFTAYKVVGGSKLPNGITVNSATGQIGGTPVIETSSDVIVTVESSTWGITRTKEVQFNVKQPTMNYPSLLSGVLVLSKGSKISPLSPLMSPTGSLTSFAAKLPSGLIVDAKTGILSGTPLTVVSESTSFIVSGYSSGGGVATFTLQLQIKDNPPAGISYPVSVINFFHGLKMFSGRPSAGSGGEVTKFEIGATPLPDGLSVDSITGVIFGNATSLQNSVDYVIVARNSGGSANIMIKISVPEIELAYSLPTVSFPIGIPVSVSSKEFIAITKPSTGAADFYSSTPSLPTGLSFDVLTGEDS